MSRAGTIAALAALLTTSCSLLLDFELEPVPECWCGERWQGQILGAFVINELGKAVYIAPAETSASQCVSQLEHTILSDANPNDPTFQKLRDELVAAAQAECQLAAAQSVGTTQNHNTCNTAEPAIAYVGPCWEPDPDLECPAVAECRLKYDCDPNPVWRWGDDIAETGGSQDDWYGWSCYE